MKPTVDVAVSRRSPCPREGPALPEVIEESCGAGYVLDLPKIAPNNSRLFGACPRSGIPLANIQSAKKRARQAVKRRAHNVMLRSKVRTAIRKVMKAVEAGNKDAAKAEFAAVVPQIDRMATKGILQKNRAAHYKSQLNARLRAMP